MNFAVTNSYSSLIGSKTAREILLSRQQELLLFEIVPAVMIGITIANKVHHITYMINSHCTIIGAVAPLFTYKIATPIIELHLMLLQKIFCQHNN